MSLAAVPPSYSGPGGPASTVMWPYFTQMTDPIPSATCRHWGMPAFGRPLSVSHARASGRLPGAFGRHMEAVVPIEEALAVRGAPGQRDGGVGSPWLCRTAGRNFPRGGA